MIDKQSGICGISRLNLMFKDHVACVVFEIIKTKKGDSVNRS